MKKFNVIYERIMNSIINESTSKNIYYDVLQQTIYKSTEVIAEIDIEVDPGQKGGNTAPSWSSSASIVDFDYKINYSPKINKNDIIDNIDEESDKLLKDAISKLKVIDDIVVKIKDNDYYEGYVSLDCKLTLSADNILVSLSMNKKEKENLINAMEDDTDVIDAEELFKTDRSGDKWDMRDKEYEYN